MQWTPAATFFHFLPSGTRWRAAACSSCSNTTIATHYRAAAAAEVHGRYIQIHTRTLCSSAQYNCNLSGQGTPLWKRTRCLRNSNKTTHNRAASAAAAALCMHIKLTSRLLRRHLNHHRTYFYTGTSQREMTHKNTRTHHHSGFEPWTPGSEGQQRTV